MEFMRGRNENMAFLLHSSFFPAIVCGTGQGEWDLVVFLFFSLRRLSPLPLKELNIPDVSKRNHRET
jgi:hypothetical protein